MPAQLFSLANLPITYSELFNYIYSPFRVFIKVQGRFVPLVSMAINFSGNQKMPQFKLFSMHRKVLSFSEKNKPSLRYNAKHKQLLVGSITAKYPK